MREPASRPRRSSWPRDPHRRSGRSPDNAVGLYDHDDRAVVFALMVGPGRRMGSGRARPRERPPRAHTKWAPSQIYLVKGQNDDLVQFPDAHAIQMYRRLLLSARCAQVELAHFFANLPRWRTLVRQTAISTLNATERPSNDLSLLWRNGSRSRSGEGGISCTCRRGM